MNKKFKATLYGILTSITSFFLYGIPTKLIPNPFFSRMIPPTIFDYIFLITIPILLGIFIGLFIYHKQNNGRAKVCVYGGGFLNIFAVSCPICNLLLVTVFSSSFLLSIYDPLRPILGIISTILLVIGIKSILLKTKHSKNKKSSNLKSSKFLILILMLFLSIILIPNISADEHIPANLQKIQEYNEQQSNLFLTNISFVIAFIAGILTILSPCILPLLPAYFSYTFKEKRNITLMTIIFFLGFTLMFSAFGLLAGIIGEQSFIMLQNDWFVFAAGTILLILGLMSFFGKGFSSVIRPKKRFKNDKLGTFLQGFFFAVGWTACVGPILGGILTMAVLLGKTGYAVLLMVFYSLGIFVPLILMSLLYDKYDLAKNRFIKGKTFKINLFGRKIIFNTTNIISGGMLILLGLVFMVFKNTAIVNGWNVLGTSQYFYSIQRWLIGWKYANILGSILLGLFIIGITIFVWKRRKK